MQYLSSVGVSQEIQPGVGFFTPPTPQRFPTTALDKRHLGVNKEREKCTNQTFASVATSTPNTSIPAMLKL